ncbi:hypothetical protein CHH67_19830 [Paenibacillus campinasensis]|uniref:Uncharacterized protein n=1 Tax=Paenibacillus campinasensis TaxID=66347 RepID=A0A268EKN0_9BACL|nr:hypothetical protein CHH67_19830 [Paenibacillus campinasensis]
MKIKAHSYWVWTAKAERQNPKYSKAGEPVWPHYRIEAPAEWLEQELICDSSDFPREGQADLFEYI